MCFEYTKILDVPLKVKKQNKTKTISLKLDKKKNFQCNVNLFELIC